MKHFLLTLLLTFIVGVCSAQTEHMKFKGVPMEGTFPRNALKFQELCLRRANLRNKCQ